MIKSEIINLRTEIDQIDENIAKLLSRRVDCAVMIGSLKDKLKKSKEDDKISAYDPIRENKIIEGLKKKVPDIPLNGIEIIFRQIISLCRNSAHKASICILGNIENFDYKEFFGSFCKYVLCSDAGSWLKELEKNEFNIGLTGSILDENTQKKLISFGFEQIECGKISFGADQTLKVFAHR